MLTADHFHTALAGQDYHVDGDPGVIHVDVGGLGTILARPDGSVATFGDPELYWFASQALILAFMDEPPPGPARCWWEWEGRRRV